MGKTYAASDIIKGNSALFMAIYGQELIATPAYPYLKWKMPWTATHYYDWLKGGLLMNQQSAAEYQMKLWQYLVSKKKEAQVPRSEDHYQFAQTAIMSFAREAIKSGAAEVPVKYYPDGSIEVEHPVIKQPDKFQSLVKNLFKKLFDN